MASLLGMTATRHDGRAPDETREVRITRGWLDHAEGSVLVEFGRTRVLCAASFTEGVPRWLKGKGTGWVTAEYAMLPRATNTRVRPRVRQGPDRWPHARDLAAHRPAPPGRHRHEALGERTIILDCDVLQADGGTRTAAITGAYVALADAIADARAKGLVGKNSQPLTGSVAAVSVGIVGGQAVLDLDYEEDVTAGTDMNVVMTGDGRFIEVQGTAEGQPFERACSTSCSSWPPRAAPTSPTAQQAALASGAEGPAS